MNVTPRLTIDPIPDRWCWIGEDDSAYLRGLVDWLTRQRCRVDQASDFHIQLVNVGSTKKVRKVLAKTKADVFVWSIDDAGIASLIQEIAWLKRAQPSVRQIAAGPASPAERNYLFEAGVLWHIEHAEQWCAN